MGNRRTGWDATRRNRNQGTAKRGHGQDNRLTIPDPWNDARHIDEQIDDYDVCARTIHGRRVVFLVEHTDDAACHACTVDDIATVLGALPKKDVPHEIYEDHEHGDGSQLGVVLFQPTRKVNILAPVWGRLRYSAEPGKEGRPAFDGPAIFLAAHRYPLRISYDRRKLSVDDQAEVARLEPDATRIERDTRHIHFIFDLEGVRRLQLYRTLLHEVGHWEDYYRRVECANAESDFDAWSELWEQYWQRPTSEREAAAHRYARVAREQLEDAGVIPFARKLDSAVLAEDGLRVEDFSVGAETA